MPGFSVLLANRAQKSLDSLEAKLQTQIRDALNELENNPVPASEFDVTKIAGSDSNYRIRLGRYRILYCVNWHLKQVKIYDIDRRKGRTYS